MNTPCRARRAQVLSTRSMSISSTAATAAGCEFAADDARGGQQVAIALVEARRSVGR